jgi:hypothetical protein
VIQRRSFMASMLAACVAPAFVRSGSLMVPARLAEPNGVIARLPFAVGPITHISGDVLNAAHLRNDKIVHTPEFRFTKAGTVRGIDWLADGSYRLF